MSTAPPKIEWFLARDGKQYQVSEVEMQKLVDLGLLKPTDLVWRAGFAEWTPAAAAFPAKQPQPSAPSTASPGPAVEPTQPRLADALRAAAASRPQPATATGPMQARPRAYVPTDPAELASASGAHRPVRAAEPQRAGAATTEARRHPGRAAELTAPARNRRAAAGGGARPRGRWARRIAVAAVATMIAAGGVVAWNLSDRIAGLLPQRAALEGERAPEALQALPFNIPGKTPDEVDSAFQKAAVWQVIKREFPEWYAERVKETFQLRSQNRDDQAIAKHLVEAVVALRRKYADQALAASQHRLALVATSFLENLKQLAKHSTDACYGFISQGEVSGLVLPLLQQPDLVATLQRQVTAVLEAIAEGRKSPQKHQSPRKEDYETLAKTLVQRGWSEADLQLFSDPRALSRAPPQQVCKMVQDWFAAQIAINDREAQLRLLVESLRPVVAG